MKLDRSQVSNLVNMTDTASLPWMLMSVRCLTAMTSDIFWLTQEHLRTLPSMGIFVSPADSTMGRPLFGVQGNPLKIYGKQYPKIEVGNLKGQMDMTMTDSAESLLSVFNMVEKGHVVHFGKDNCHLVTNQNEMIPLEQHGK